MIKFFEKIKQKLLSYNPPTGSLGAGKFSRDLIYAKKDNLNLNYKI